MRIKCPACAAVYEIPDSFMRDAPGIVRCARCSNEWSPAELNAPRAGVSLGDADPGLPRFAAAALKPALAAVTTEVSAVNAPSAVSERRPAGKRGGRPAAVAGWLLTAALLSAGFAAAYAWRGDIQRAWPPSQRAYAALGLADRL